MIKVHLAHQRFELASVFTISRGSKTHADVVQVTLERNGFIGRGECVPYPRYDETVAQVLAAVQQHMPLIAANISRAAVQALPMPYAARNAVDCALWDLEAKESGTAVCAVADFEGIGLRRTLLW